MSQKQTGDARCTSSAIDATEDLEENMPGPSNLSNVLSKEDQTDLESSSISHYDIGNFIQRSSSLSYDEKIDFHKIVGHQRALLLGSSSMTSKHSKLKTKIKLLQPRWFDQHKWLYHSAHDYFKGGCCLIVDFVQQLVPCEEEHCLSETGNTKLILSLGSPKPKLESVSFLQWMIANTRIFHMLLFSNRLPTPCDIRDYLQYTVKVMHLAKNMTGYLYYIAMMNFTVYRVLMGALGVQIIIVFTKLFWSPDTISVLLALRKGGQGPREVRHFCYHIPYNRIDR